MTAAFLGPSPKTVWVAFLYKSQPRQSAAASFRAGKVNFSGRKSTADRPLRASGLIPMSKQYQVIYPKAVLFSGEGGRRWKGRSERHSKSSTVRVGTPNSCSMRPRKT